MDWHWRRFACGMALFINITNCNQVLAQPGPAAARIFFTVSTRDNSSAALSPTELTISVDKQPAKVISVRPAKDDPLLFAVLVDVSTSNKANAAQIKQAALQIFRGLSAGANRGYLVLFNQHVAISGRPLQPSQLQPALDALQFSGGTAVYDAIAETCAQPLSKSANPDTPRRIIVLLSDGDDNQSHVPPNQAYERAEKEGIAIFSLDSHASGGTNRGETFLKDAAGRTGGEEIIDKSLPDGTRRLLSAINQQWALTFAPTQGPNEKLRSFSLKSFQPGILFSAPAHVSAP